MTASLRWVALMMVLAIPVAAPAWIVLRRVSRLEPLRRKPGIVTPMLGAVVGQVFGLAVFALVTSAQASGEVEIVNGVFGYGTLLFSPWAGVGAWGLATALGEQADHRARALFTSCAFAVAAVLGFLGGAFTFKLDGVAWMVPYAISPVLGALVGYRVGAFGISTGLLGRPRQSG